MYAVPGVVLTWWASGAWVHGCLEERVKDFSSSKIHHECHEHDKHHRYMARKLRQFNCITRCAYHILVAGDGILPFKPPTTFMLGNDGFQRVAPWLAGSIAALRERQVSKCLRHLRLRVTASSVMGWLRICQIMMLSAATR